MNDHAEPDIWRSQAKLNIQGLINALSNDDAGIRRRAAVALKALSAFDAIPQIESALKAETDSETRAQMQMVATVLKHEAPDTPAPRRDPFASIDSATRALIDDLRSGEAGRIIEAARRLGEQGEKAAVETLVILFNQPEAPIKVRLAAAEALLKMESAPIEVSLLGALQRDDWRGRRNSAAILGQLRAEWAVDPLIRCLSDDHLQVRRAAYAALRHIGTPTARLALQAVKERTQARLSGAKFDMTETQQIQWPRQDRPDPTEVATKPLNPDVLNQSKFYQDYLDEQKKKTDE